MESLIFFDRTDIKQRQKADSNSKLWKPEGRERLAMQLVGYIFSELP